MSTAFHEIWETYTRENVQKYHILCSGLPCKIFITIYFGVFFSILPNFAVFETIVPDDY